MEQNLPTPSPFISIDSTVEIEAPIAEVFERWCRVEEFPSFMEGVREIRWLDEKKFSLKSENDGQFYHSLCARRREDEEGLRRRKAARVAPNGLSIVLPEAA